MLTALTLSKATRGLSVNALRGLFFSLFVASLIGVSGCGPKDTKNSVSGKVTLNGEPVDGIVAFVGSDNKEVTGPTKPDGSYEIIGAPVGQVKIIVKRLPNANKPTVAPPKDAPAMPSTNNGVPPPVKYGATTTSDLSFEVKKGKQIYDIKLTP